MTKDAGVPRLVAPGPVPVRPAVVAAMGQPMPHHRSADFCQILGRVQSGLRWLFETEGDAIVIAGSGTTGMEAALVNFADPNGKLLTVGGGKFSERWGQIARAYGLPHVELSVEWGQAVSPRALDNILEAHPDVTAVALTACETSTAVANPIAELCGVVRARSEALILMDGITAVGVSPLPMDALGIDVVVAGSQKVFGVPPGLACLGISPRAWALMPTPGLSRYSLDLRRERDRQREQQTAFSPAITLVMGLDWSLREMRAEGRASIFERHARHAQAVRAGVAALGLRLYASAPCDAVTAAIVPEGVDGAELVRRVRELGVILAGGQGKLAGKIVRVGHLGSHTAEDLLAAIEALGEALQDQAVPVSREAAREAAEALMP